MTTNPAPLIAALAPLVAAATNRATFLAHCAEHGPPDHPAIVSWRQEAVLWQLLAERGARALAETQSS